MELEGINKASNITYNMVKSFLALSGGGDRGCVLIGMLTELYHMKGQNAIQWEEIGGISAGALVGSLIAQTDAANFEEKVKEAKTIFLSGGFHVVENWVYGGQVINLLDALLYHESVFQNNPMKLLIENNFDKENLKRKIHVGAYNKTKCTYQSFDSSNKDFNLAIMASASVPVILPSVQIGEDHYEDGGMRHLIPVMEIKQWIQKTIGPKHVDVMVCFPINNTDAFIKMTTPETTYPLLNQACRSMSDIMLQQMMNDLKIIAELCDVTCEELSKSNCNEFVNGDLTIRLLSPSDGTYSSFIHMNPKSSMSMFESGARAVREYLTPKLKY